MIQISKKREQSICYEALRIRFEFYQYEKEALTALTLLKTSNITITPEKMKKKKVTTKNAAYLFMFTYLQYPPPLLKLFPYTDLSYKNSKINVLCCLSFEKFYYPVCEMTDLLLALPSGKKQKLSNICVSALKNTPSPTIQHITLFWL